jgi:hypothetical protein
MKFQPSSHRVGSAASQPPSQHSRNFQPSAISLIYKMTGSTLEILIALGAVCQEQIQDISIINPVSIT